MNYKMLILLIVLIMSVVGISGCTDITDSTTMNVFNEKGVYFEYPSDWKKYNPLDDDDEIAAVGNVNESSNSTMGEYVCVFKHDQNKLSVRKAINNFKSIAGVNYTEGNIIVDGVNATLIKFTWKNVTGKFNEHENNIYMGTFVYFEKNGYTYVIQYYATPPESYNEKTFKKLITSFKVQ